MMDILESLKVAEKLQEAQPAAQPVQQQTQPQQAQQQAQPADNTDQTQKAFEAALEKMSDGLIQKFSEKLEMFGKQLVDQLKNSTSTQSNNTNTNGGNSNGQQ